MKLPGSVQNPGDPIRLPATQPTEKPDYEAELAIVLGRECRDATPENALSCVLGYACANDVSARDWQRDWSGSQWCHAKSFDTFCPLGPVRVTPDELPDSNALRIRSILNGTVMQDSNTADMIFHVPAIISFLSADKEITEFDPAETRDSQRIPPVLRLSQNSFQTLCPLCNCLNSVSRPFDERKW